MAVTLLHTYRIKDAMLDKPEIIQSCVSRLVPSPPPADLTITVGPDRLLLISFSYTHADPTTAAVAAIATMQGLPIP